MVSEDNVSRVKWLLAKVEKVHPGKDGLIRTATVRTQRGLLNRPVQRLHKLEVESSSDHQRQKRDFSLNGGETSVSIPDQSRSSACESNIVPQSVGQGGEDVTAQSVCKRTRSGRPVRTPRKLYE